MSVEYCYFIGVMFYIQIEVKLEVCVGQYCHCGSQFDSLVLKGSKVHFLNQKGSKKKLKGGKKLIQDKHF